MISALNLFAGAFLVIFRPVAGAFCRLPAAAEKIISKAYQVNTF